jgi:ATP-dependent Lon protease
MSGQTSLPSTPIDLPLLPLRDVVVFPHMVIPLFVGRPKSIKALESAMEAERRIMLVAQKAAAKDEPSVEDMFEVGCVATILQLLKLPDGTVKVLVEGQQRATVNKIEEGEQHFTANVTPVETAVVIAGDKTSEIEALRGSRTCMSNSSAKSIFSTSTKKSAAVSNARWKKTSATSTSMSR